MKTLYKYELPYKDPASLFTCLSDKPYSLFFDSSARSHELGRYSFIVFDPFETIEVLEDTVEVHNATGTKSLNQNPFQVVKERLQAWEYMPEADKDLPPFQGGAAGFFGYDLVRCLERLPSQPSTSNAPDMAIGLYDQLVCFDHLTNRSWFITICETGETADQRLSMFKTLADKAPAIAENSYTPPKIQWQAEFTRDQYEAAVQKVIDYIYAGDVFQANFSQRLTATLPPNFDHYSHYRYLREINPAPFSSFMNFGRLIIASASPERFLYTESGQIQTRPIKGTRPRHSNKEEDEEAKNDLRTSEKDRAENVMIVDLLRNDLSKVCKDETVEANKICHLESFANVHHLVSTVSGQLARGRSALDALEACFPGGSITGAPKVRAMEIINELENNRRGPYCGSIGYIGFDGTMDTNIAIRTLIYEKQTVRFNVGGGIVAASNPAAEYQETLDKALGLLNSFTGQLSGKQPA